MADLATVRFQNENCGSQSNRTRCDSSAVEILENPEAFKSEFKFNNIEHNYCHDENHQERQLLKILWRNGCRYRPISWCLVLVFLWAVLATIFCLGIFLHKDNKKDGVSFAAFQKGVKLTTSELPTEHGDLTNPQSNPLTSGVLEPLNSSSTPWSPLAKPEPTRVHGLLPRHWKRPPKSRNVTLKPSKPFKLNLPKINFTLGPPIELTPVKIPDEISPFPFSFGKAFQSPVQNSNPTPFDGAEIRKSLEQIEKRLSDLDQQVKDQGKQIIEKISTDHVQLEQKLEGVKTELRTSLNELDSKNTKEVNSALDEVNKEISGVKEQIKSEYEKLQLQMAAVNFSSSGFSSSSAAMISIPAPAPAPRFFLDEEYKGAWFAPAPGWEKKCSEMPSYMKKQASSVKVGGHCLLVCASANCESGCTQIHPDSYGLEDLAKFGFHDRIISFRQCKIN